MAKKAPPIRFAVNNGTKSIERSYQRLLLRYQREYQKLVMQELGRVLPELREEAKSESPDVRMDADFSESIEKALARASALLATVFPPRVLRKWVAAMVGKVDTSTDKDMEKMLGQAKDLRGKVSVEGTEGMRAEVIFPKEGIRRATNDFYKNIIDHNIGLIESIDAETNLKLKSSLTQMLIENRPQKDIAKVLSEQFGASKSKARLIARDQVMKLNGNVNRLKQQALGINKYVWRTVRDERVRSRHKDLDGKTFSWDDPPRINPKGDRGHPGDDYQCRCYAEAVLDEI